MPTGDIGLLGETGALFRAPGGNVEHPENQESVIRWGALNIGGEVNRDPSRWDTQRRIYTGRISAFPWLHCHTYPDIDYLIATAQAWHALAIGLNIEDVVDDHLDLDQIADQLSRWPGDVLVISLAWLQNHQGWQHLSQHTFALEIFPLSPEDPEARKPQDCIDHAYNEIGPNAKVTFMYETKAPNQPGQYDLAICHSFFTGDDIGVTDQDWNRWQHTGPTNPAQPTPAPPPHPHPQPEPGGHMAPLPYHRTLKLGTEGWDVDATKRAIYRYLNDGKKWTGYLEQTLEQKQRFGVYFQRDLGKAQDQLTAGRKRGELDEDTLRALEGAEAFDGVARELWLRQAPPKPKLVEPKQGFKSLVQALWLPYTIGRNLGLTDLGTYNPASTLPSGAPSDHAYYPAYAFDLGFTPPNGYQNPIARKFFGLMAGRPGIHYVICGNQIWSREEGHHPYTHGGHESHVHTSGIHH